MKHLNLLLILASGAPLLGMYQSSPESTWELWKRTHPVLNKIGYIGAHTLGEYTRQRYLYPAINEKIESMIPYTPVAEDASELEKEWSQITNNATNTLRCVSVGGTYLTTASLINQTWGPLIPAQKRAISLPASHSTAPRCIKPWWQQAITYTTYHLATQTAYATAHTIAGNAIGAERSPLKQAFLQSTTQCLQQLDAEQGLVLRYFEAPPAPTGAFFMNFIARCAGFHIASSFRAKP